MADGNFFQKLFSSFFGSSDPAAEKKRQLKAIAKQVGKSKYKFYKTSSGEVLASFAKYFYDIYKAISQAQALFLNTQNKEIFKRWVVDYYLTDKQRESIENLSEESIIENAKTLSFDEITSKIGYLYYNKLIAFWQELCYNRDIQIQPTRLGRHFYRKSKTKKLSHE